jgi:hypothetical protein
MDIVCPHVSLEDKRIICEALVNTMQNSVLCNDKTCFTIIDLDRDYIYTCSVCDQYFCQNCLTVCDTCTEYHCYKCKC